MLHCWFILYPHSISVHSEDGSKRQRGRPKKIVGTTPKNPVGRPRTRYVPFTPVLTDHVCILFSISFMVTSDNQIREFQLETPLTLHQHFLQAEKVLSDSAPYLNGMYQAITMLHRNMSSLICRCKLTIS